MKLCSVTGVLIAAMLLGPSPASGDDDPPPLGDALIHSDVPLFGDTYSDKWPQPFANPITQDFGCTSRVRFGDWVLRRNDRADNETWYRISNYGVFHCWANVAESYSVDRSKGAASRPSFFVRLSKATPDARGPELWALQLGARPGSDYLLLARSENEGAITSFTVLQRRCDRHQTRRFRGHVDILRTDYCVVRTRAELASLARLMAALPPLGTFSLQPERKGSAPHG